MHGCVVDSYRSLAIRFFLNSELFARTSVRDCVRDGVSIRTYFIFLVCGARVCSSFILF